MKSCGFRKSLDSQNQSGDSLLFGYAGHREKVNFRNAVRRIRVGDVRRDPCVRRIAEAVTLGVDFAARACY